MTSPFDPGLQPERTLLAWRRTCLSIAAAGAIGARISADGLGALAIGIGIIGVALGVLGYLAAHIRYERAHGSLVCGDLLPDGRLLALLALSVGTAGLLCAGYVMAA
jgi:putative membrane protein